MKIILTGILSGLSFMAFVFESNNGMLFFLVGNLSIFLFCISTFTRFSSQGKRYFGSFICSLIIFWVAIVIIGDKQGLIAEKKLKGVVKIIEDYKLKNGRYPSDIDNVPRNLKWAFVGVFKRPMNLYEFTDTTFKVGWDYERRVYYSSEEDWYINNLELSN